MLLVPSAQVRPRSDAFQAHRLHVALHRFAIDRELGAQGRRSPPQAIEGMRRVNLINPVLDGNFFRRRWDGLIVQTGPAEPQELGLQLERQARRRPFDRGQSFSVTLGRD